MRHERSESAHEERVALYKSYEYQHAGPNSQGEQTEEKRRKRQQERQNFGTVHWSTKLEYKTRVLNWSTRLEY